MVQTISSHSQCPLEALVARALGHLKDLGFSDLSLKTHRRVWENLIKFSKQDPVGAEFSEDLAASFLASRRIPLKEGEIPLTYNQRRIRGCIRKLATFAMHGYVQCKRTFRRKLRIPGHMEEVLEGYLSYLSEVRGVRPTSLRPKSLNIRLFLHFLESRGVRSLTKIQPGVLTDFISSRIHLCSRTVANVASDLRSFLRYLCVQKMLPKDLSPNVPKVRTWRQDRIPSVWNRDDVDKMLARVNRSSPVGKRNYAILLLACRLGLRAGDIRTLRLENIRWEDARIEIRYGRKIRLDSGPGVPGASLPLIDPLRVTMGLCGNNRASGEVLTSVPRC
jgi:integrase